MDQKGALAVEAPFHLELFGKKIKKINTETRTIYKGIGNDAKLIVEDMVALGKKNLDKIAADFAVNGPLSKENYSDYLY